MAKVVRYVAVEEGFPFVGGDVANYTLRTCSSDALLDARKKGVGCDIYELKIDSEKLGTTDTQGNLRR